MRPIVVDWGDVEDVDAEWGLSKVWCVTLDSAVAKVGTGRLGILPGAAGGGWKFSI